MIAVQAPSFSSMKKLYSPAGTVVPPIIRSASVLIRVVTFAPARQTGPWALSTWPYSSPAPKMPLRPRRIGRE